MASKVSDRFPFSLKKFHLDSSGKNKAIKYKETKYNSSSVMYGVNQTILIKQNIFSTARMHSEKCWS